MSKVVRIILGLAENSTLRAAKNAAAKNNIGLKQNLNGNAPNAIIELPSGAEQ